MIATATNKREDEKRVISDSSAFAVSPDSLTSRPPRAADAAQVSELVRRAGTLEPNSTYAYVLLCTHFAETGQVAESGGRIVGCALGYRLPQDPSTLFLWQIGVAPDARRRGIARQLLSDLLTRCSPSGVERLETTVAPSNAASRKLFESWSQEQGFSWETSGRFDSCLFGDPGVHEDEQILRITCARRES